MRLKFGYRKFPSDPSKAFPQRSTAVRPVIPITVINGNKKINYFAIVDSGADLCIFHAEIGEQIGIDIERGRKQEYSGIMKKDGTAYFHDTKIAVGGHEYKCYAGFSRDLGGMPYGILGQTGFFDLFAVTLDYNSERIELVRKDNA